MSISQEAPWLHVYGDGGRDINEGKNSRTLPAISCLIAACLLSLSVQARCGFGGPLDQIEHAKWSQRPIEIDPSAQESPVFCGWDEPARSTQSSGQRRQWRMDADDFRCLGPAPVTRIRWWGGYKAWNHLEPPEVQPMSWHIGVWANQVEGLEPSQLYLGLVWSVEIPDERVHREPVGLGEFPEKLPAMCFLCEVDLEPEEWFHQAEFQSDAGVFWLSITAVYPPDVQQVNLWGWKTRPHVWRDGAVSPAIMGEWPTHDEQLFPGRITPIENSALCGREQPHDLCFELLTEHPWVKWDQPFTGIRDWPHYEAHLSMATEDAHGLSVAQQVSDDWLCESRTPIVAISWHGSYIGYGYDACRCNQNMEPRRPDYFLLTVSANASADAQTPFAHPGQALWQFKASNYDEVLVGFDKHPDPEPNERVFRYSVRLPNERWFWQDGSSQLLWFSALAVYGEPTTGLPYRWGWTNHPHTSENCAVAAQPGPEVQLIQQQLQDHTGAPIDMSFTLHTCPIADFEDFARFASVWQGRGPDDAHGDLNHDGDVDFGELHRLTESWLSCCPGGLVPA